MRVFLIDKYNNNSDLINLIKKNGIDNIESREQCNIKFLKNDVAIVMDNGIADDWSKTVKTIFITQDKSARNIWNLANNYNCLDIIDGKLDRGYIVDRIVKLLNA